MKKHWSTLLSTTCLLGAVLVWNVNSAHAIKQFFDEFKAHYVKADSSDATEKAFAAKVDTAKCNVCHMGDSKKMRNPYGTELAKLLKKDRDKTDKAAIDTALETVSKIKSAGGETYGDLIKAGKLPGGN